MKGFIAVSSGCLRWNFFTTGLHECEPAHKQPSNSPIDFMTTLVAEEKKSRLQHALVDVRKGFT